jgi:hypothetical protein
MKRLYSEYVTALDLAVIAVHWLAASWEPLSPGVAGHLRKIADGLARKAKRARHEIETETEVGTRIYGVVDEDDDKTPPKN